MIRGLREDEGGIWEARMGGEDEEKRKGVMRRHMGGEGMKD